MRTNSYSCFRTSVYSSLICTMHTAINTCNLSIGTVEPHHVPHGIGIHVRLHCSNTRPRPAPPHPTTLHYTTLHPTTPHQTTLHYTTPHYTPPHHTTPHHTTPHHTTLHYTTPHTTPPHTTTEPSPHTHCHSTHRFHEFILLLSVDVLHHAHILEGCLSEGCHFPHQSLIRL